MVLVLALSGILLGGWPEPAGSADIRSTPHNLTRKGALVEADDVCIFCHTPQFPKLPEGVTPGPPMQPAWQRALPDNHSFVMFDDIGRNQFTGDQAVGSQSIACLSCHDANQAFSVTSSQSDHPFGIPYKGYSRGRDKTLASDLKNGDGPARSANFMTNIDDFRFPSRGKVENRNVWWVSASGVSAMRARSDLPLYARQGGSGEIPYVECSSCHDPHVTRPLFLRVSNEGSKLCLTCHDK